MTSRPSVPTAPPAVSSPNKSHQKRCRRRPGSVCTRPAAAGGRPGGPTAAAGGPGRAGWASWPPRSRCPSGPSAARSGAPAGPAGTMSAAGCNAATGPAGKHHGRRVRSRTGRQQHLERDWSRETGSVLTLRASFAHRKLCSFRHCSTYPL